MISHDKLKPLYLPYNGRMVTNLEGLLHKISHDSQIMCSKNITLKTKTIIFPVPQYLWQTKLEGWSLTFLPINLLNPGSNP